MLDAVFDAAVIGAISLALASAFVLVFERSELETGRVVKLAGQLALGLWFAYWSWQTVASYFEQFPLHMDMIGFDGRIYQHAAQTWLSGGDPWASYVDRHAWGSDGYLRLFFAGPPPTVLAFAPLAWLSNDAMTTGWMALTVGSAVYTLRRLDLPLWWILFPPMVQGIFVGNPHIVCLALLLSGSSWLQALAAPMKAYAVIPMVTNLQWRPLAILAVVGTISLVVFWPLWNSYRIEFPQIQATIQNETWGGFSAARDPTMFMLTGASLAILALIDRRGAGWLAVPALWPAAEFFYATFALPLKSPWLLALLAVPASQADAHVPWAIIAYAAARVVWRFVGLLRDPDAVSPGQTPEAGTLPA
jgi:hypothetical protein